MGNSIQRITRHCEAADVFKVAGKDSDLGRGNLNGLEHKREESADRKIDD